MNNIILFRSEQYLIPQVVHHEQAVVSVFGDVAGYEAWCQLLERAKKAKKPEVLQVSKKHETMQCVVTPAQKTKEDAPFLHIPERLVFRKKRPTMELVVAGNAKGYDYLINFLKKSIEKGEDHLGFFSYQPLGGGRIFWKRFSYLSVIPIIHPPLKKWDNGKLAMHGFKEVLETRSQELVPKKFRRLRQKGDYIPVNLRHYRILK